METVYSEAGLNEPAKAVEVLQVVVAAKPTDAALYAQLAEYAYKAKNTRVGDLASEKAVSLAPAVDRKRVKDELAEIKANPSGEKTVTTTTNGKTYTGKVNSKGELQGTEVKTTSTPREHDDDHARPSTARAVLGADTRRLAPAARSRAPARLESRVSSRRARRRATGR